MVNGKVTVHQIDSDENTTICGIFLLDTSEYDQGYPTEARTSCKDCLLRVGKGLIIE